LNIRVIGDHAILILTASLTYAQQTPPLAGIAHVAIRVRSLDAARDFYPHVFTLPRHGAVLLKLTGKACGSVA
jgi:catechol-2,3-dioxygenase